jgi:tetratricopeptide (TPR) repeat protein
VDSSGRWHTLQLHLKSARAAREAGDVQLAIQEVDAALSIDPDYLAARVLREAIANPKAAPPPAQQPPAETAPAQPERQSPGVATPTPPSLEPTPPPSSLEQQPPGAPTSTPLSLEERVRHRRVVLRIGAAQTAILLGRFPEARAALDELTELEPTLPAIPEIEAEFRAARSRVKRKRLVLVVGVAAGVAGAFLGSSVGRVTKARLPLSSAHVATAAPLPANAIPTFNAELPGAAPTLSAGFFEPTETATLAPSVVPGVDSAPLRPAIAATEFRARVQAPATVGERVSEARFVERPSGPPVAERSPAASVPVERVPEASPAVAPRVDPSPAAQPAFVGDDPALIRDALQRYRRAYNALDARLAHAVYPGVDETALTHAFDGLRSQSLEFEACSVDSLGASARAVCRGQARYVTKIGSREPRSEPRVWTFRLRKDDGDWTIESAWTNR